MSADLRSALVAIVGALVLAFGVGMIFVPAGVIVLGATVLVAGLFADFAPRRRDRGDRT